MLQGLPFVAALQRDPQRADAPARWQVIVDRHAEILVQGDRMTALALWRGVWW